MRPIKFKAWHTRGKKMFTAEELGTDQMTLSVDGRGYVNVSSISTAESQFAGDLMIPLQFIGLKDRNGKEIYEGDIIQQFPSKGDSYIRQGDDPSPLLKIVCWDEEDARFELRNMRNEGRQSGFTLCRQNAAAMYEVVGNIFEERK